MGLWDWIVDNLTQSPETPAHGKTAREHHAQSSVTVEETPASCTQPTTETTQTPIVDDSGIPWWTSEDGGPTEMVTRPAPELTTEERALENALIDQFDGHDLELPPFPRVPEIVLKDLRKRNCDFGNVARDIAEDQVIAAAVVRMANSPLYRGMHEVTALKQAITRLGATALRTLMFNQSMRVAAMGAEGVNKEYGTMIMRRSLASATIMSGLSQFTGVDQEEAFLIGLLHDIGNVVVLREASRQQRFIDYELRHMTFEYLCDETHQEFGELIAKAWSLPPNVQQIIAGHHEYPAEDDPLRTERLLIRVTDMICAILAYSPHVPYDLLQTQEMADLNLATRQECIHFLYHLPEQVEDMIEFM